MREGASPTATPRSAAIATLGISGLGLLILGGVLLGILWVEPDARWLRTALLAASLLGAFLGSALLALHAQRMLPGRGWVPPALLALGAVLGALIAAETAFTHYAESDTGAQTLAGKIWVQRYFQPINRSWFRDREHVSDPTSKRVVVLGDSIAAGWGIDDMEDRFSNLLEAKLPAGSWIVENRAVPNTSTANHLTLLGRLDFQPDVLVLAYFVNDIDKLAQARGFEVVSRADAPGRLRRFVTQRSYLANYLLHSDWTGASSYYDVIREAFASESILAIHRRQLIRIIQHRNRGDAPLIVVMFPFLHDREENQPYYSEMLSFFTGNDLPVVDVLSLVEGYESEELVVNRRDVHPNELVHRLVADALHEVFVEQGIVPR